MRWLVVAMVAAWLLGLWCVWGAVHGRGWVGRLRALYLAVVFGGIGVLLGLLLLLSQAFHVFSGETLVARVTTLRLSPDEFELVYTPAGSRQPQSRTARLRGDQWSISGGIIKWHPWLTALGLPSYHKPIRLGGQYADLQQQRARLPTVYPLEPAGDRVWETLYRLVRYLPFIDAVYGSSAYVYVESRSVHEIYVTPSGYLITRAR